MNPNSAVCKKKWAHFRRNTPAFPCGVGGKGIIYTLIRVLSLCYYQTQYEQNIIPLAYPEH